MLGGFENYIIAGLRNKKVPLTVVVDRSKADYEISGVADSEKAGWAKMLFLGSQNSNEQASIKVADLKTGELIFGYSVHKTNSVRGRQSAGEGGAPSTSSKLWLMSPLPATTGVDLMTCNKSVARVLMILVAGAVLAARAEERKTPPPNLPKGAKVFIAPTGDGFETYLKEAIAKKQVPVVASRDQADYEIIGVADSQKASTAKKVILGNWHWRQKASVAVSNIKSSEVVWACSVRQDLYARKADAEACAKHLKDAIEK